MFYFLYSFFFFDGVLGFLIEKRSFRIAGLEEWFRIAILVFKLAGAW